jgi:hypothetical protein
MNHVYDNPSNMKKRIEIQKEDKTYHFSLDENFHILEINEENQGLLYSNQTGIDIHAKLNELNLAQDYEKQKKIYEYLKYFEIPAQFNLAATKTALARVVFLDALVLLLGVLKLPLISQFICQNPVCLIVAITCLAIASVHFNEPIVKLGFRA